MNTLLYNLVLNQYRSTGTNIQTATNGSRWHTATEQEDTHVCALVWIRHWAMQGRYALHGNSLESILRGEGQTPANNEPWNRHTCCHALPVNMGVSGVELTIWVTVFSQVRFVIGVSAWLPAPPMWVFIIIHYYFMIFSLFYNSVYLPLLIP